MSEAEGIACLLQLLNRLVGTLERLSLADTDPGARCDPVPERWQDKDYLYLEAHVPDAAREIDISFHGERAFIRIGRQD